MQWSLKSSQVPQTLDELTTILLKNRGVTDQKLFFSPPNPCELSAKDVGIDQTSLATALARLAEAQEKNQDVVVFGDYDADGICSTATLWLTLHHLGYQARPFIPHRVKHGYGLSQRALDDILAQKKPDLIITVDNGIVAHEAIERLNHLGIDTIITDHHQPEDKLPPARAIVHTTQLCGTTVAWMLAKELDCDFAQTLLDLAGIATIADQVKLLGANRSFAHWGIKALQTTAKVGILELCQVAGIKFSEVTETQINYCLAPRINAMGRLDHGLDALRLLCTSNSNRAQQLVQILNDTNVRRQDLTDEMVNQAMAEAKKWADEHLIVVASSEYHEGVIGLIAGKLAERFSKPAIVISVGEKVAKASARSIQGVNIVELIRQVRDDLLEVGGHPMAAGFGLVPEKIDQVKTRLCQLARDQISAEQLKPTVAIECEIPLSLVTLKLAKALQQFQPFGQANPEPVFSLRQVTALQPTTMGKDKKHLKFAIECSDSALVSCIAWNKAQLLSSLTSEPLDIAGLIEVNEWKGKSTLQLKIKDFRFAQG